MILKERILLDSDFTLAFMILNFFGFFLFYNPEILYFLSVLSNEIFKMIK